MDNIGPYLLESLRSTEGSIEIWNAQDAVTGVSALIYKPVIAKPPRWRIIGVLPWTSRVADAWVAELPFGAVNLSKRNAAASAEELTAWSRQLLATILEMEALNLQHGRISIDRFWIKGSEIWLDGLGLPVPAKEPDIPALVAALKTAAGDSWHGWPYFKLMNNLANGEVSLREAAERLAENNSAYFPNDKISNSNYDLPSAGTVKILSRGKEKRLLSNNINSNNNFGDIRKEKHIINSNKKELDIDILENENNIDFDKNINNNSQINNKDISESKDKYSTVIASERQVVRIEESIEPTFDVIEPQNNNNERIFFRVVIISLTIILFIIFLYIYHIKEQKSNIHDQNYFVEFRLEPQNQHAELVLLEAPEESQLVSNRVLAVIPGKVYFDVPGAYRIQLRADGYLPQEKLLTIPPSSRVITVRLNH